MRTSSSGRRVRRVLLVVAIVALAQGQALAQIRAERAADGRLLLTNRSGAAPPARPVAREAAAGRAATAAAAPPRSPAAYEPLVREHAARQGLRPSLVRAVIAVESNFDPLARSPKGAMGLMQLMPATARDMGVRDPWDPAENVRGGTTYLRQLLDRYDGNETLALAAYNAGATAVDQYAGVPPFPETRRYVELVGLAAGPAPATGTLAGTRIYASEDVVDGRVVRKFSNLPPRRGF